MALKRINKELSQILPDGSEGYIINPIENDCFNCDIKLIGPKDTVYDGGLFHLEANFPKDYPFKPPKIYFKTKIYHPDVIKLLNKVQESGFICCCNVPILSTENWSPAHTIKTIMDSIKSIMIEPNVNQDCNMVESKKLYKENKEKFNEIAKEWVKKYAV